MTQIRPLNRYCFEPYVDRILIEFEARVTFHEGIGKYQFSQVAVTLKKKELVHFYYWDIILSDFSIAVNSGREYHEYKVEAHRSVETLSALSTTCIHACILNPPYWVDFITNRTFNAISYSKSH